MEEKFRIFEEEKFNKILDLIEDVDLDLANMYKKVVLGMPKNVLKAVSRCEDFDVFSNEFDADMLRIEDGAKDSIFYTFQNYKTKLKIEMSIFPFSNVDLDLGGCEFDENNIEDVETDKPWFVFSLTLTKDDTKSFDWEVYVQPYNGEYQIISVKNFNEQMIGQQVKMLSYGEMLEYADYAEVVEEEFEGEEDFEYDGVAEYDEEGNLITELFKKEDFEDVKIDEESGEPEVEIEFEVELPDEEDSLGDEPDNYEP